MRRLLFAVFVSILAVPAAPAWAAESPFTGTWKGDPAKIGLPERPERWVLQNGRFTCETCEPSPVDVKADGTDQPRRGNKDVDTTAVKVVNEKTVEITDKKDGQVVGTARFAVSADGNTLTIEESQFHQASKDTTKVTGTLTRVAAAPQGAHAISGAWRQAKVDAMSQNSLTFTMKGTEEGLSFAAATGESWEAKYDGRDYPVKGRPAGTVVSLKKLTDRSVDETLKMDGKVARIFHLRVSEDGRTLTIKSEGTEPGTTVTVVATKQGA